MLLVRPSPQVEAPSRMSHGSSSRRLGAAISALDVVEALAQRIGELEDAIVEAEAEGAALREEAQKRLSEEVVFAPRKPARSIVPLNLDDEVDEGNIALMESDNDHIGDPKMRARTNYIGLITRNTDASSPARSLIETWKAFE